VSDSKLRTVNFSRKVDESSYCYVQRFDFTNGTRDLVGRIIVGATTTAGISGRSTAGLSFDVVALTRFFSQVF